VKRVFCEQPEPWHFVDACCKTATLQAGAHRWLHKKRYRAAGTAGGHAFEKEEELQLTSLAAMAKELLAGASPLVPGTRLKQIVEWLRGGDGDPLIVFDVRPAPPPLV